MKCGKEKFLIDYMDGALQKDKREETERHLDSCALCRSRLELMLRLKQSYGKIESVKAPSALSASVMKAIELAPRESFAAGFLKPLSAVAAAAALLIVARSSFYQVANKTSAPSRVSETPGAYDLNISHTGGEDIAPDTSPAEGSWEAFSADLSSARIAPEGFADAGAGAAPEGAGGGEAAVSPAAKARAGAGSGAPLAPPAAEVRKEAAPAAVGFTADDESANRGGSAPPEYKEKAENMRMAADAPNNGQAANEKQALPADAAARAAGDLLARGDCAGAALFAYEGAHAAPEKRERIAATVITFRVFEWEDAEAKLSALTDEAAVKAALDGAGTKYEISTLEIDLTEEYNDLVDYYYKALDLGMGERVNAISDRIGQLEERAKCAEVVIEFD